MPKQDWEFLQSWLMRPGSYNGAVKKYFADVNDADDSNVSGRAASREACLIKDSDSALLALHRRLNFYFEVLEAHLKPEIFAVPPEDRRIVRANQPKVTLVFRQDRDTVVQGKQPLKGEISFRIMGQKSPQISMVEINTFASKIRSEFIAGNGYLWHRGKSLYSYTEWERGYQFELLCNTETQAKELVKKVLSIQNHAPVWKCFNTVSNDVPNEAYPNVTDTVYVLGEPVKVPQLRAEKVVRFAYATIHLPPAKPRTLIDRTNRRANPLVEL